MKRILIIVNFMLLISIMPAGCAKYDGPNLSASGQEKIDGETIETIVYFSDAESKFLAPVVSKVNRSSSEEGIIKEIIKGPSKHGLKGLLPKETKVNSVKIKDKTAYVDFNSTFKNKEDKEPDISDLKISSVVNSLTQLPYITSVQLLIEGKKWGAPVKRIRSAFKRENLNPSEVMKKQMDLEKSGDWLNAYLLMADEYNEHRKSYNDYKNEIEEAKGEGLLEAGFSVGEYKIDPGNNNKASVKVNFVIKDTYGKYIKSPDVFFNTVKTDGYWMVDWFTGQR